MSKCIDFRLYYTLQVIIFNNFVDNNCLLLWTFWGIAVNQICPPMVIYIICTDRSSSVIEIIQIFKTEMSCKDYHQNNSSKTSSWIFLVFNCRNWIWATLLRSQNMTKISWRFLKMGGRSMHLTEIKPLLSYYCV